MQAPELVAKAEENRLVRVIVKVHSSKDRDGAAGGQEVVERNKARLVETMRDNGAVAIEPLEGLPLIVMEVTPQGLKNLLGSDLVETVEEDKPEQAF